MGGEKRKEKGHPPISNEAFRQVLVRMDIPVTGHGFRSTFKTWAIESPQGRELRLPEVILEAAIGHSEGDAIKAAYTSFSLAGVHCRERRRVCTMRPIAIMDVRPRGGAALASLQ